METKLTAVSTKILDFTVNSSPGQAATLDPATIAQVGLLLLQLFQACRKLRSPERIKEEANHPTPAMRLGIRRHALDLLGRDFVRQHGRRFVDKVIDAAATASDEEYAEIEKLVANEPLLND